MDGKECYTMECKQFLLSQNMDFTRIMTTTYHNSIPTQTIMITIVLVISISRQVRTYKMSAAWLFQ